MEILFPGILAVSVNPIDGKLEEGTAPATLQRNEHAQGTSATSQSGLNINVNNDSGTEEFNIFAITVMWTTMNQISDIQSNSSSVR